jgi:hypothetical protein
VIHGQRLHKRRKPQLLAEPSPFKGKHLYGRAGSPDLMTDDLQQLINPDLYTNEDQTTTPHFKWREPQSHGFSTTLPSTESM